MMTKKDIRAIENCDYVIGDGWETGCKVEVIGNKAQVTTIDGITEKYDIEEVGDRTLLSSNTGDLVEVL